MPRGACDLINVLSARGLTVATAESLTGGQVAAALTSVPGASRAYVGGVVSYATDVKVEVLGVPRDVVATQGVISAACAEAMASGVRRLTGADVSVSTTGVAGPDSQEGHPVGTVFVGVDVRGEVSVSRLALTGDRGEIQRAVVNEALALLTRVLRGEETRVG